MNKTRFSILLTTLILLTFVLTACDLTALQGAGRTVRGSGNVTTQEEVISDFDSLDVSHGFHVDVQQGDNFSVVIRIDNNLVEHLKVVKDGDTLKIGFKPERSYNIVDATLEADVTMPGLTGLDLSSGSHVTINGLGMANSLEADLSDGSHLQGDIEVGDARFDLSGGSEVTLSGSAGELTIDASGGSHAKLANLSVGNANVDASGGSHVTVNPSGTLDADANGGSHIIYLGNPTLGTIDDDASSSIKKE